MKKEKIRVALDGDNVAFDFDNHWRMVGSRVLGRDLRKVSEDYHLKRRYGLNEKEHQKVWKSFNHEVHWGSVPLFDYAQKLIYSLEDAGAEVFMVTSIQERFYQARVESLSGLVPGKRVIAVDTVNAAEKKKAVMKALKISAMLEDNSENANKISEVAVSVLLNQGYEDMPSVLDGVKVIEDPMDYVHIVKGLIEAQN